MQVEFRPATAQDVDVVVGFARQLNLEDPSVAVVVRHGQARREPRPFDERKARGALELLLREPPLGRVWVIRDGTEPIGYLVLTFGYSLEYGGKDAFVDELFVRASHRGRGVGTAALRLADATCRELGVRALHLEVERSNTRAQRLYRRAGFQDHDRYLMTRRIEAETR